MKVLIGDKTQLMKQLDDLFPRGRVLFLIELKKSAVFPAYTGSDVEYCCYGLFTTHPNFVVGVTNRKLALGKFFIFEHDLDPKEVILQLTGAVVELFPSSYFREKRGIILEVCKLIIQVLQKFDKGVDRNKVETEEISMKSTFNQTETYTDIESIEDLMDEWYKAAGYVDYPMVPFN